jgi:DNA uptake protein ComE-like DNA-binding protein
MRRRGVVLVAVLIVAALVAVIAASVMFRMRAEVAASAANTRGEQASEAALSGIARAVTVLKASAGDSKLWYDNPDLFQNVLVADDASNKWYFTVYADPPEGQTTPRYGLTDEASKINLNTAPQAVLLALPNMTAELVDCLLDYRGGGTEPRADGAKQDYYDQLPSPYVIPQGPLSTLEELFLVKGFNAPAVWGEDANFNGILDPNEDDGDATFPPDDHDGRLNTGLRGVATVYSSEPNTDQSGKARVNISGDAAALKSIPGISQETAQFIQLYRAEGNTFKHPSELLELRYQLKEAPKDVPGLKQGSWIESKVTGAELATVLDRLTIATDPKKPITGLVNVNTAPPEVLAALPGLDPNLAQQIVDARRDMESDAKASIAWLYTQNLLDAAAFKSVAPYLTARSYQYTVRCIGFGVPCGRYRVIEAVVDVSGKSPRVVYLRDISRLGLPFALDVDSMERSQ